MAIIHSTTFPHQVTFKYQMKPPGLAWCAEQGYVVMQDYLLVTTVYHHIFYFKNPDHAMLFKLTHAQPN